MSQFAIALAVVLQSTIAGLPNEILNQIAGLLDPVSLQCFGLTNKNLFEIAKAIIQAKWGRNSLRIDLCTTTIGNIRVYDTMFRKFVPFRRVTIEYTQKMKDLEEVEEDLEKKINALGCHISSEVYLRRVQFQMYVEERKYKKAEGTATRLLAERYSVG
ncbi:hypothetical protein B0J14DRAFT_658738 [Halenospora varia]|nr:hypothetical protein B0J14DRAFT_658738 [Halenospora varia]